MGFAAQPATATAAPAATNAWRYSASLSVKESYDDNVYLQDVGDLADQDSLITTVIPRVALGWQPGNAFRGELSYAPEVNVFHSTHNEDFTLHRVGLALGGGFGNTTWEATESFIAIDGSSKGLIFLEPGGAPATGGPQIRDRRDAVINRGLLKIKHVIGNWFIRPVLASYVHNFQAHQYTTPGYLNYVDRSDLNGGVDLGRKVQEKTWAYLGYRYGFQTQDKLFDNPVHFDSTYNRVLVGLEGMLFPWLQVNVQLGPEFREYCDDVSPGFDHENELYLYVDTAVTIIPTQKDTITLSAKRFEQPGFGGRSTYIDSTYDLVWRHKFTSKLTVGAGFRAYSTYFLLPAQRDDWILTPSGVIAYNFTKNLSGECSYLFDTGFSRIPDMEGRNYTHNQVSLGLRYVLK